MATILRMDSPGRAKSKTVSHKCGMAAGVARRMSPTARTIFRVWFLVHVQFRNEKPRTKASLDGEPTG